MAYQGGQLYTLDVGKDTQHPYKTVTIERPVDELALRIYRTAVLQIRQGVAMVFSQQEEGKRVGVGFVSPHHPLFLTKDDDEKERVVYVKAVVPRTQICSFPLEHKEIPSVPERLMLLKEQIEHRYAAVMLLHHEHTPVRFFCTLLDAWDRIGDSMGEISGISFADYSSMSAAHWGRLMIRFRKKGLIHGPLRSGVQLNDVDWVRVEKEYASTMPLYYRRILNTVTTTVQRNALQNASCSV